MKRSTTHPIFQGENQNRSRPHIGPRHTKIGDEGLLALDLVTRDRVLALPRNQPIDEGLAQVRLHMRVLGGVHQYHGILVEQPLRLGPAGWLAGTPCPISRLVGDEFTKVG
jgi:hypothetical protein